MPDYIIELSFDCISKKNSYQQTKSGRRFKPKRVVDGELIALSQIPAELVDLKLKHPRIEFQAFIPKKSWSLDIDGVFTTILDILVKAGILAQDNIRNCNGGISILPVQDSARKRFVIKLTDDREGC